MSDKRIGDDGAFAMVSQDGLTQYGLTKREYYAAMAMKGILDAGYDSGYVKNHSAELAKPSVLMADALIEELNKESANE